MSPQRPHGAILIALLPPLLLLLPHGARGSTPTPVDTAAPPTSAPLTPEPATLAPTEAPKTSAQLSDAPVTDVPMTVVPATDAPATVPLTVAPGDSGSASGSGSGMGDGSAADGSGSVDVVGSGSDGAGGGSGAAGSDLGSEPDSDSGSGSGGGTSEDFPWWIAAVAMVAAIAVVLYCVCKDKKHNDDVKEHVGGGQRTSIFIHDEDGESQMHYAAPPDDLGGHNTNNTFAPWAADESLHSFHDTYRSRGGYSCNLSGIGSTPQPAHPGGAPGTAGQPHPSTPPSHDAGSGGSAYTVSGRSFSPSHLGGGPGGTRGVNVTSLRPKGRGTAQPMHTSAFPTSPVTPSPRGHLNASLRGAKLPVVYL